MAVAQNGTGSDLAGMQRWLSSDGDAAGMGSTAAWNKQVQMLLPLLLVLLLALLLLLVLTVPQPTDSYGMRSSASSALTSMLAIGNVRGHIRIPAVDSLRNPLLCC